VVGAGPAIQRRSVIPPKAMASDPPAARELIDTLVARWSANPFVEAVLLFGSHAHGAAQARSDIDLYVLASDASQVADDGLHWMEGHLVEVFVNTRSFFEGHFERFHADHSRVGQSQFATATLLFDRRGEGTAIQQTAQEWLAKPRMRQTTEQAYWPKRIIWSRFHRLEELAQRGNAALGFVVHGFIYDVYSKYAAFLGQPVMPADRLEDYLADDSKRRRYLQEPFPDDDFTDVLLRAVRAASDAERFELARQLKEIALREMGGFEPGEMAG
jgi:predicted nucleotidyltransferase